MMQMTWYVWYTYTWYTLLIVCFNIKGEKIAGELWRKNQDLNQNYWSSVVFCPVHFLFQVQKIQLLRWPFKKSFEVGWINSYQICRQVTYKCPTSRLFFFFKHEGVICSHRTIHMLCSLFFPMFSYFSLSSQMLENWYWNQMLPTGSYQCEVWQCFVQGRLYTRFRIWPIWIYRILAWTTYFTCCWSAVL